MKRIPELDGVRGLAILLVMLHHSGATVPAAGLGPFLGPAMEAGWTGVDLFFVLSGFLITGILIDTRNSPHYFLSFYARRVLRIFPLYLAAVFVIFRVIAPLARHAGHPVEMDPALEPWFWIHLSNWKIATSPSGWVDHFWSLSIEEQFYLVWPFLVFVTPPRRLAAVSAGIAAASFAWRAIFILRGGDAWAAYTLTPMHLEPLAAGAFAATLVRSRAAIPSKALMAIGVAAFAILAAASGGTNFRSGPLMVTLGLSAATLAFFALVLYALAARPAVLRNPVLRSFGKYSYAMYMVNSPFARVIGEALRKAMPTAPRFGLWLMGFTLTVAATYLAALVTWNVLEKHFLGWKRFFRADYGKLVAEVGVEPTR